LRISSSYWAIKINKVDMVKLNRIYTRTGDDGTTGLVGGKRTKKNALRVIAYGEIDETNAHIGAAWTIAVQVNRAAIADKLRIIENELFDIGAELATPPDGGWEGMVKTGPENVDRLERWIDELNGQLPELRSFVLPGGTALNAQLHVARTVCRRAERSIVTLSEAEPVSADILHYVNRLSDLLFVMSRFESLKSGCSENLWVPGGSR
jgi:cob(I)alamin adenosyltransferase